MFRRRNEDQSQVQPSQAEQRITSVLGDGTSYHGKLSGSGGVRIEGAFDGEIALQGLLVIGTTGRVTCEHLRANSVIVAGAVRGNISAEKVEIRETGRVWGDVTTLAFSTEEGAFLRGQIRMEEEIDLELEAQSAPEGEAAEETAPEEAEPEERPTEEEADKKPRRRSSGKKS